MAGKLKLYKAITLLNLRYDNQSYEEGQELGVREDDIKELEERKYVKMVEKPSGDTQPLIPPVQENNDKVGE